MTRVALGFALGLLAMLALGAWERRRALQCMLGLAVLAGPAAAQDRSGICALNMGQLVREDSSHVRSGNSGWDACVWATADIGEPGGWWASLTVAPSRLFVWRVEAPVSRWSWRPGRGHRSIVFTWLWPEVGYTVRERPVTFDVAAGFVWPVQTSYEFGAPIGAAPSLMGSMSKSVGPWSVEVRAGVVYNRATGWVVLEDFAGHHSGPDWEKHDWWVVPVSVRLGVR